MNGYTKLFGRILDSTIWQEDNPTRILWITMLAMSDMDGQVMASVPGLASRAKISLSECEAGLAKFQEPDIYSQSTVDEGRRIQVIPGGWLLINYEAYRQKMNVEEQREKARLRQQRSRMSRQNVTKRDSHEMSRPSHNVTPCNDIQKQIQIQKEEIQEEKGLSPEGQPAINLAKGIAEHLDLVVTPSILLDIEAAVRCAAKKRETSLAKGCDYLIGVASRARERGIKINQFWFRDADGWEPNDNYKTAAQLRNERSAAAIERAFAEDDGPEDVPSGVRERPH